MGANARRRHGPVNTAPKEPTGRIFPLITKMTRFGLETGVSNRARKAEERRRTPGPNMSAHDSRRVPQEA